jgi:hypothetical protein
MNQRLKRWESPRKQGRNDKGKGGTARARQLRKREQMLRQKLKGNGTSKPGKLKHEEREITPSLFLWAKTIIIPNKNQVIFKKSSPKGYRFVTEGNPLGHIGNG